MSTRHPVANVLNLLLWLGHENASGPFPVGSGVISNSSDNQLLVTALHVAEICDFSPLVRFNGKWNPINWRTIETNRDHDIAVLQTDTVLDDKRIPVLYGEPEGLVFGQIGYALGFPRVRDQGGYRIDHIIEAHGRPMPIVALAVANFVSGGSSSYSSSYINDGFSGGAIVFPVGQRDWTIAGIITHFPTVPRPIYRDGKETGDYIMQHTGLVGCTPFGKIEEIIGL